MTTSKCSGCAEEKPLEDFYKRIDRAKGHTSRCKACLRTATKKKGKTKLGLLFNTYTSMSARVRGVRTGKESYIGLEILDKEDFIQWSLNNIDFHTVFKAWEENDFIYKLTPSIDRIDPRHGYELFNMGWVTVSENSKRANMYRWHRAII